MLPGVTVRSITRSNGWLVGLGALVSNTERFMTPEEVADVLRVSISQVYTLMRSGQLNAVKIGKRGVWRVSPNALNTYVSALEAAAFERSKV
ncbi:MAG: helix-turn-helix domain-containing protein [Actinobacteria bacterium]|uniref:Unannotated protein n=1 Tax=freshwater metagenome TaxID=449393 RepID=A0A6J6YTV9_9ZZZZ|nr:helix-turn-helix domain-containing protein [Actinomycetota bacterium]MSX82690.1 helix-turn-helix domain-containing protein [Actinomycetota bacterium]